MGDNLEFKEKKKLFYKKWYSLNKERQKKNVLRDSYKNRNKWTERGYADRNKKFIWMVIGKKCKDCGGIANEINHLKYDFPKRANYSTRYEKEEYLIEYCKFLEPLCMPCHRKKKQRFKYNDF